MGSIALFERVVEKGEVFAGELLMAGESEGAAVLKPLKLAPALGELIVDVPCGAGVVGELLVLMPAELFGPDAEIEQPVPALFTPIVAPFLVFAGLDEELHLHLLEFAGAGDEVLGGDLVAEGFADLGDAEGGPQAGGLHDDFVVDVDALGGFGAEVGDG